jgi:4-alpha-glucanotransferase
MNSDTVSEEWEQNHSIVFDGSLSSLSIIDSWQARHYCLAFYSAAFTDAIFARPLGTPTANVRLSAGQILIKVFAPLISPEHSLAVTGNQTALGLWNPAEAPLLQYCGHAEWCIAVDARTIRLPLEYKFIVVQTSSRSIVCWENGDNRMLDLPAPIDDSEAVSLSGLFMQRQLHAWRGAGTAVPVFSLRTARSYGVGDLGDLRLFIDWIRLTGQRFVQLLPMNDTTSSRTWRDSYPYSAISVHALHPMYINLPMMGALNDTALQTLFEDRGRELNALAEIDYEAATSLKLEYCRAFYLREGRRIIESDGYRKFCADNSEWLNGYAAFSCLRDKYGTADFSRWESDAAYNPAYRHDDLPFYCFLQYILQLQFAEVAAYARSCGVVLKGDLPIGVNRHSVDTWINPQYFNCSSRAGAPPDVFSATGQNWGFPTYNWDAMESDGFSWWKSRFAGMSAYFDCFRIDHVLGFFRIWEIPADYTEGLCGHFNPSMPLSAAEIEAFGMTFNEGRLTTPHIHRQHLRELFGEASGEVCDTYLAQSSSQHYVLKPFCNTQAKIAALLTDGTDRADLIRRGLNVIAAEALFLRDPRQSSRFHPRISAQYSYIYNELSEPERQAFNRLYDDYYYHRHEEFWRAQAYRRLTPLLRAARMLPCGEDLGMIPASVPEVMNDLQILSLEIERMSKSSDAEFSPLRKLPYMSVCTTSTHDMSPLRNWWEEEDRAKIRRYYQSTLCLEGEPPAECTASIAKRIVENHLAAPSMLAIMPLQDWLAVDANIRRPDCSSERINIPSRPDHYWRYRMHLNIEELLEAESLNAEIKCMIRRSGRE